MSKYFQRNRHKYPPNWNEIAAAIKTHAGWKCESCLIPHLPSPNVLTVHHLDHNPANNLKKNLIALCQRCHLSIQALRPRPQTKKEAIYRLRRKAELQQTQQKFEL